VGLVIAVLVCGGCGLSDYERRMSSEQERVQRFDLENKILGDPVPAPQKYDDKEKTWHPVLELFFRVPRGIRPTHEEKPVLPEGWVRYPRSSGDSLFSEIYVGATTDVNKDFGREAEKLCGAATPVENWKKVSRPQRYNASGAGDGQTMDFDARTLADDKSTWSIYILKRSGGQVGIIFRGDKGDKRGPPGLSPHEVALFRRLETAGQSDQEKVSLWSLDALAVFEDASLAQMRYRQPPSSAASTSPAQPVTPPPGTKPTGRTPASTTPAGTARH
jgi:hypothetical protein